MKQFVWVLSIAGFLFTNPLQLPAQLWQRVGGGLDGYVTSFFPDSASGLLYVGGYFSHAGDTMACNVATWDGIHWNKVGTVPGDSTCPYTWGQVASVMKRGSVVFASGAFVGFPGSSEWKYLLGWRGTDLDTTMRPDGGVHFEVTNNELLGLGTLHEINGVKAGRIIRWNGINAWEPFCDSLPFLSGTGFILTSEYYQGKYYFGGNYAVLNGMSDIDAWDGYQWQAVGGGLRGDSWVNKLKVFKGQLFVGGEFLWSSGNASSYLTAWDGNRWYDPLPMVAYSSQVRDLSVIDGVLYILGRHSVWNGSNWQGPYNVARYDGITFCSIGGSDIMPYDIAGLNGHIYVSTGSTGQTNPYRHLAEWIGGDSAYICISQPVRITDPAAAAPLVSLFPNPTQAHFMLTLPAQAAGNAMLEIRDLSGRVVLPSRRYGAGERVEVDFLPAGVYFVEVETLGRREVLKMVRE